MLSGAIMLSAGQRQCAVRSADIEGTDRHPAGEFDLQCSVTTA
jgi:hypothetical protein